VESWFSSIRLLSDAVVVEALGDLSNCPALGRRAHHLYDDAAFDPSSAAATDAARIAAPQGR